MTTHSHNNERRIICPTHINAKQQRLLETAMVEAERILSLSFPFFITDPYSGKFDRLGLADVLRLTRKRILITRIDLATEQLLSTISTGQVKPSCETPYVVSRSPSTNRNTSTMARLSNVNGGLPHTVGRRSKSLSGYGRHNRHKKLSRVYGQPLSPRQKSQPRSQISINDQSVHKVGDSLISPNSTQKLAAKSSPASSPARKPRRHTITNARIVQLTHALPLQPRTASNRNQAQSRSKLPLKPIFSGDNTCKSRPVENQNQAKSPLVDATQLTTGVSNVPILDGHIQAGTAPDNSILSPPHVMAEVGGRCDLGDAKESRTHTGDGNGEYFEVETIKSCKLGSKVRHFSRCTVVCSNFLPPGDSPLTG